MNTLINIKFNKQLITNDYDLVLSTKAFSIRITEPIYSGGPIEQREYLADSVKYTDATNTEVQLKFLGGFNNAIGDIIVVYNGSIGSIFGDKGPLATFECSFSPTSLTPAPRPGGFEKLNVGYTKTAGSIRQVTESAKYFGAHNIGQIHLINGAKTAGSISLSGTIKP